MPSNGDDFALTQFLTLAVRVFETFGRPANAEQRRESPYSFSPTETQARNTHMR